MRLSRLQLVCCLFIVACLACLADGLTESRRTVLFDFTHGKPGTAALQEAERRHLVPEQLESLRQASQRLRKAPKDKLLAWYRSEGEALFESVRVAVVF